MKKKPPKTNKSGTREKVKIAIKGCLEGTSEKILKITDAMIKIKTAVAALVGRSFSISLK